MITCVENDNVKTWHIFLSVKMFNYLRDISGLYDVSQLLVHLPTHSYFAILTRFKKMK